MPKCVLPGAGLAAIKGSIIMDHILPPAEGKKKYDSDNCSELRRGSSDFLKLLFSFCLSLANTCH